MDSLHLPDPYGRTYAALLALRPEPCYQPFLLERFGINGTFNSGAIKFDGKYVLVVRVEGNDRKSFFRFG